jgi:hypothetical protein
MGSSITLNRIIHYPCFSLIPAPNKIVTLMPGGEIADHIRTSIRSIFLNLRTSLF